MLLILLILFLVFGLGGGYYGYNRYGYGGGVGIGGLVLLLIVLYLLFGGRLRAQTPGEIPLTQQLNTRFAVSGDMGVGGAGPLYLDPSLKLTRVYDANKITNKTYLSVPAAASAAMPTFGHGFVSQATPGSPPLVSVDTSVMMYRTTPPAAPGPCKSSISDQSEGTAAFAADSAFVYFCVADPATPGAFRWARAAFQTAW